MVTIDYKGYNEIHVCHVVDFSIFVCVCGYAPALQWQCNGDNMVSVLYGTFQASQQIRTEIRLLCEKLPDPQQ